MDPDLKTALKASPWVIVGVPVLIIVILLWASMWVFSYGFYTDHTANRRGETQKKQLVEGNGQFRIAAYDHFFDLCAGVQATEDRITINQGELTTKPYPDAQRQAVLRANITALESVRAEAIRQYNQDARKSYTIGQFRSSDLPFQLDITDEETSCTSH